jgi:hypothetical protein
MKRYLLFGDLQYYAAGGWADFRGSFDTIAEAEAAAAALEDETLPKRTNYEQYPIEWWHVIDSETGKMVADNGAYAYGQDNWYKAAKS